LAGFWRDYKACETGTLMLGNPGKCQAALHVQPATRQLAVTESSLSYCLAGSRPSRHLLVPARGGATLCPAPGEHFRLRGTPGAG
jgi:hypothetical protein